MEEPPDLLADLLAAEEAAQPPADVARDWLEGRHDGTPDAIVAEIAARLPPPDVATRPWTWIRERADAEAIALDAVDPEAMDAFLRLHEAAHAVLRAGPSAGKIPEGARGVLAEEIICDAAALAALRPEIGDARADALAGRVAGYRDAAMVEIGDAPRFAAAAIRLDATGLGGWLGRARDALETEVRIAEARASGAR